MNSLAQFAHSSAAVGRHLGTGGGLTIVQLLRFGRPAASYLAPPAAAACKTATRWARVHRERGIVVDSSRRPIGNTAAVSTKLARIRCERAGASGA